MFKIQMLDKMADAAVESFDDEKYHLSFNENDPDAIIVEDFDVKSYPITKNVIAIAKIGSTSENIPLEQCTEEGIALFNTPLSNVNAIKELEIASILLASRNIVEGINFVSNLSNVNVPKEVNRVRKNYIGPEIRGKSIGIIGLGSSGILLANACATLGMAIHFYDPYITNDILYNLPRGARRYKTLEELLPVSDYLTIHLPLIVATKELINESSIGNMKNGVCLINFANPQFINSEAVLKAVENGKIGKYVTDFPSDDMININNIISLPNIASLTPETIENGTNGAVNTLKNYLEFGNISNSLNLPNCALPVTGSKRISVVHKNIPTVLSELTLLLSENAILINDIVSKRRGNIAYTLIDVGNNQIENEDVVKQNIAKIAGVLNSRIL